ncbi:9487_t:CDS:2 [Entrophospora sp. SA101]|nr:9487_t:CDS:2 [Entrophospora sp. SA101]
MPRLSPSSSLVKRVFAQCDDTFPMTFDSFVITPDPVVVGKDASLSFNGTTTEPIESGTTYSLVSTVDGVEYPSEGDFCTTFNQTCPVAAGPFTFTGNDTFPAIDVPAGETTTNIKTGDFNFKDFYTFEL